jgi:hypothetical protein
MNGIGIKEKLGFKLFFINCTGKYDKNVKDKRL